MKNRVGVCNVGNCACFLLVLCVTANCGPPTQQSQTTSQNSSDGTVYYLDAKASSITQPIDSSMKNATTAKFVQVEITSVQNPRKQALMFEVHYEPTKDQKLYLGTFSLFPADNPGTFIVPTQGKVKNQGALVVSMIITDKADNELVKVGVKKLQLRNK